jgi:hypothetical protein
MTSLQSLSDLIVSIGNADSSTLCLHTGQWATPYICISGQWTTSYICILDSGQHPISAEGLLYDHPFPRLKFKNMKIKGNKRYRRFSFSGYKKRHPIALNAKNLLAILPR